MTTRGPADDPRCVSLHPTATLANGDRLRCYHGAGHEGRHGNGANTWGDTALAALHAEHAELRRMEAATDTTCHCGQPKDAHRGGCDAAARLADLSEARRLAVTALEATTAEAATLRERAAALSEHVARVTGERIQAEADVRMLVSAGHEKHKLAESLRIRAIDAEWELGRLREALERIEAIGCTEGAGIVAGQIAGVARAARAAIPHTEGEASE